MQACAYKVGEIKIKELRRKAEQNLGKRFIWENLWSTKRPKRRHSSYIFVLSGDKFDIKDYHHVFLSAGPMGLDTLEEAVDEYIDNTLARWTQELLTRSNCSAVDHFKAFGYITIDPSGYSS